MSSLIRAFIALPLPAQICQQAMELQTQLKQKNSVRVSWAKSEKMHITLKFLGEISQNRLKRIQHVLHEVTQSAHHIKLQFEDIGCFPDTKTAKVVYWRVLDVNQMLIPLQQTIETKLQPLGFARENRSFIPHLTLGRIRDRLLAAYQLAPVQACPDPVLVEHVHLMQSLGSNGASYTILKTYPLI